MNLPFLYTHGVATEKTAVLVHGLSDSPYTMKNLANVYYDQGFNVVGVLLRGHGSLPEHLSKITANQWREDVDFGINIAQALNKDPKKGVSLVGFSTGGALSVDAAYRRPSDVADLVLLAPLFQFKQKAIAKNAKQLKYIFSYLPKKFGDSPYSYDMFHLNSIDQAGEIAQSVRAQMSKAISKPTMIIQSEADTTISNQEIKNWASAQQIPQKYLINIPLSYGVLHRDLPMKNPAGSPPNPAYELIVTQVKTFLDDNR
jgi:alpha-beta hydrolase superfamily lysophospholipase